MTDHPTNSSGRDWRYSLGGITPFTKSNGTLMAKIYERLTKASRRRADFTYYNVGLSTDGEEAMYRRGVYDTLRALQEELS